MTDNTHNVFSKHKFKMPRPFLKIVIILGVVLFVIYGWALGGGLLMLESKGRGITAPLLEIAQGSYPHYANDIDWVRPALTTMQQKQTCSRMGGAMKRFSGMLNFHNASI